MISSDALITAWGIGFSQHQTLLTLTRIGGAKGYCNRFVCLFVCLSVGKFQQTYEHWHFENTTSILQIMQESKNNNRLLLKHFCFKL